MQRSVETVSLGRIKIINGLDANWITKRDLGFGASWSWGWGPGEQPGFGVIQFWMPKSGLKSPPYSKALVWPHSSGMWRHQNREMATASEWNLFASKPKTFLAFSDSVIDADVKWLLGAGGWVVCSPLRLFHFVLGPRLSVPSSHDSLREEARSRGRLTRGRAGPSARV